MRKALLASFYEVTSFLEIHRHSKHAADTSCKVTCIFVIFVVYKIITLYECSKIPVDGVACSCMQVMLVGYAFAALVLCVAGEIISHFYSKIFYWTYFYLGIGCNLRSQCKQVLILATLIVISCISLKINPSAIVISYSTSGMYIVCELLLKITVDKSCWNVKYRNLQQVVLGQYISCVNIKV